MDDESVKLSGKIQLTGFKDVDGSSMNVISKIINSHAKRIAELTKNLESLHITVKSVHEREKSEKYEIHAKIIDNGKVYASEITDRNLLVAVDTVLKKMINELD